MSAHVHLPVHDGPSKAGAGPVALARHPNDGYKRATPYPMSAFVLRAFHAQIRALLPPPPAPQPEGIVTTVETHVRSGMPYMHWTASFGLVVAIVLLDWLPILTFAGGGRLQKMDRERASGFLGRVGASRHAMLRMLMIGVRGSVLSAYFDQDEVHAVIGYEPIPFIRERVEVRARLLAERDLEESSGVRRKD